MQLGNYGREFTPVCVLEQIPKNLPQTLPKLLFRMIEFDAMHQRVCIENILNFFMVILQLHNIVPLFYRFVDRMCSCKVSNNVKYSWLKERWSALLLSSSIYS